MTAIFFSSLIGGFIGGLVSGFLGKYFASESAPQDLQALPSPTMMFRKPKRRPVVMDDDRAYEKEREERNGH